MEDSPIAEVSLNNTPLNPPLKVRGGNRAERGGGVIDLRQSLQYGNYIRSLGWVVVGKYPQIFIRKLEPFGAIAKIQRFNQLNWGEIQPVLKKYRVWMTKLEPNFKFQISNFKFRQDSWPMLATKTLRIDLTPSLEKINSQFKKDCRSILRKLSTEHLALSTNNFEKFYEIWKKAAGIKHLWIPPKKDYDSLVKCFGKNCFCITVHNLAGSLVLVHDQVAYYYYSGALPEGKKLELPYLVVWECLKEAKKRGCKIWDFEGIYDERWPNKGWKGFSHFKKSFGGYEVEFPGSFTKWF